MIARVRRYHAIGSSNLVAEKLAARRRIGLTTAHKAKQFFKRYSQEEVDQLLELRLPEERPLHWAHVQYLLTLPCKTRAEKAVRRAIQIEAAQEDWTARELYEEIKKRTVPKRMRGVNGRPTKQKPGTDEFLESLIVQVDAVSRGLEKHFAASRTFRRKLRAFGRSVDKLQQAFLGYQEN